MKMFNKLKDFFNKKRSQQEMWDKLKETNSRQRQDEFNKSLDLNLLEYMKTSPNRNKQYMKDLIKRRQEAHDAHG